MERFSQTSRRIDQYIGRVAVRTDGATTCDSSGNSGTAFE